MDLKMLLYSIGEEGKRNAPTLCLIAGIIGFGATCITIAKSTPKAELLVDEAIRQKAIDTDTPEEDTKLTPVETVTTLGKAYWLPAVMGGISIAFFIAGHHINERRAGAAIAAYMLSDSMYKALDKKVKEKYGEEAHREIESSMVEERLIKEREKSKTNWDTNSFWDAGGTTWCYDTITGARFLSDKEDIRRAVNSVNEELCTSSISVTLADFYDFLGVPPGDMYDRLGWDAMSTGPLEVSYFSKLVDDVPVLAIKYNVYPYFQGQIRKMGW